MLPTRQEALFLEFSVLNAGSSLHVKWMSNQKRPSTDFGQSLEDAFVVTTAKRISKMRNSGEGGGRRGGGEEGWDGEGVGEG